MTVGAFSALQASKRLAAEPQGRPQKEKKTNSFRNLKLNNLVFLSFYFFHLNFSPLRAAAGLLSRSRRSAWRVSWNGDGRGDAGGDGTSIKLPAS